MNDSPQIDLARLDAVLFDFDGTLVDSYPAITASVNHVRASQGMPPLPEEEVRQHVGRGPHYLLGRTVPGVDPDQVLALYRGHHPTVMREERACFRARPRVVAAVKAAGKKVGLCSNKPRAFSRELLVYLGLRDLFDAVLGPEDVPQPKPAPDMLVRALEVLGVASERTLYIGDMSVDIQTGRQAGVRVWVVPTGSETEEVLRSAGPDRLVPGLNEVLALLNPKR